jgi:hypothetical protein
LPKVVPTMFPASFPEMKPLYPVVAEKVLSIVGPVTDAGWFIRKWWLFRMAL